MRRRRKKSYNGVVTAAAVILVICAVFKGCGSKTDESSSLAESEAASSLAGRMICADEPELDTKLSPEDDDGLEVEVLAEDVTEQSTARTVKATKIYAEPSTETVIATTEDGEDFVYSETDDLMWYRVTTGDGDEGYIYGECLHRLDGNEIIDKTLVEEAIDEKLEFLQEKLPEGKYWNHIGTELAWGEESPFIVTDTPCSNNTYGTAYCNFYNGTTADYFSYGKLCQCLGFASLLSDQVFGEEAPVHIFYDIRLLRVGDHIRLGEYEHSMTVTEITDEYVTVAEVNENYEDCKISWSRKLSKDELRNLDWDAEYISRYPLCPDGEGGFGEW